MSSESRYYLPPNEMPRQWYNLTPDLPEPVAPPLHPGTRQPAQASDFAAIFPEALIEQEMSQQRWVPIPEELLEIYSLWRPTPLIRAKRFEEALGTPARIFFKYEGVSPAGSHKPNTAVAQAYYNFREGVHRLVTETGAGQWGSALAFACNKFGLECSVYMVRVSYEQKPYRRALMELWGARVTPSPSNETKAGRAVLAKDPDTTGSLGIAISEAIEIANAFADTKYSLGSVLNHVLLHQSIIGLETEKQLDHLDIEPEVIIGCAGGGSNLAGIAFPFVRRILAGEKLRLVAVEPTACPSLTKGRYDYDFGDTAGTTPLLKMYTLGHDFVPAGIHAGGLRYHGMAPLLSACVNQGLMEAVALPQNKVFEAAVMFAKTEGIVPAPESAHAIRAAMDEALRCKEEKRTANILFLLSGHGHFDLSAYDEYLAGKLVDVEHEIEPAAEAARS